MKKEIIYPVRINKYLAYNNFCTRREADAVIKSGRVKVNGRMAIVGQKVNEGDRVDVQKDTRKKKKKPIYLAFNKPRGIVTHSPQEGERGIEHVLNFTEKVFPVGRLDKDSYGLIILTNDGRIVENLLQPDQNHEKEYVVKVDRKMTPGFINNLASGVILDDGYQTKQAEVKRLDDFTFRIILTEGKKRQIRRMCEKLERRVLDLKRERIMNITLGSLKSGQYRSIDGAELETFLKSINIDREGIFS